MTTATRQQDKVEVIKELSKAGVTTYGLLKSESRYLRHVLHENEHIQAVVYGQHHNSSAMLIATDERIIYLDKKLMAVFMDEVTYDVVSGVELDIHTFFATVTLHTAVTNYVIRYANIRCADNFVDYIEEQRLRRELEKEVANRFLPARTREEITKKLASTMVSSNMAGYYWLPPEDEREDRWQSDQQTA